MDTTSATKSEEKRFNSEEITTFIKETLESTLADHEYSHAKVPGWNSSIIETILKKLKETNNKYKYVVTCVILQNKGSGFHAASSVIWDSKTDDSANYRFESKSLYGIVNVFALSL